MFSLLRRLRARLAPPAPEPLMYRVHLFGELMQRTAPAAFEGRRILEIGPKDGLDSRRLGSLRPSELVLMDLPEKASDVTRWLSELNGPVRYVEANFNYVSTDELRALGCFDLIWCTGVLYHNAEQLRFLRKLYQRLEPGGHLVLESATLRGRALLRDGPYVEIHYPETYRNTGTITHLPSRGAIKAWLSMVGFRDVVDSSCYRPANRDLETQRYACICRRGSEDEGGRYYAVSGRNPAYRYGDAS